MLAIRDYATPAAMTNRGLPCDFFDFVITVSIAPLRPNSAHTAASANSTPRSNPSTPSPPGWVLEVPGSKPSDVYFRR